MSMHISTKCIGLPKAHVLNSFYRQSPMSCCSGSTIAERMRGVTCCFQTTSCNRFPHHLSKLMPSQWGAILMNKEWTLPRGLRSKYLEVSSTGQGPLFPVAGSLRVAPLPNWSVFEFRINRTTSEGDKVTSCKSSPLDSLPQVNSNTTSPTLRAPKRLKKRRLKKAVLHI